MSFNFHIISSRWNNAREGKSPEYDIALYVADTLVKHEKESIFFTTGDILKRLRKRGVTKIEPRVVDATIQGMIEKNGLRVLYFNSTDKEGVGYGIPLNSQRNIILSLYQELLSRKIV